MKRFILNALLAIPAAAAGLLFLVAPAFASTTDTIPPEIGLVSPTTFAVNHLTVVQATVKDVSGISNCHLYVNGADAGTMRLSSGSANMDEVFPTVETRLLQMRCVDTLNNIALSPVTAAQAETPTNTQTGTLPLGFTAGMIVRLSCLPNEVNDDHCQNIYYVGNDAKRHAFQSPDAFMSWYPDGAPVIDISLAAISSLPLGAPVSDKPGDSVIRFLSQPTLYSVALPKQLRKLDDPNLAADILGTDWKSRVNVLTDAFYSNFTFGSDVTSAADITATASTLDETFAK